MASPEIIQLGDAKDPLNRSADNVFRSIDNTVDARITEGFEVEKERSGDEKSNEKPQRESSALQRLQKLGKRNQRASLL
jgi:hypothetical protein